MKRYIILVFVAALLAGCSPDRSGELYPQAVQVKFDCVRPSITVSELSTQASFEVKSNVPWNVRILSGEDWLDECTLSGTGDGSVDVKFTQNLESGAERYASLRLWSAQDESVTLDLSLMQDASKHLEASLSKTTVGYKACELTLKISSNVAWTISADSLAFSATEGKGSADVTVKVPEQKEYTERYFEIKVIPQASSVQPVELTLTQNGPFAPVKLYFTPADWSPTLTPVQGNLGFTGSYTYIPNNYTVEFCCTDDSSAAYYGYRGFSSNTVSGKASIRFNTNKAIAGWIKLPCPEDRAIKSVSLFCPNTSSKQFTIYDIVSHDAVVGDVMSGPADVKNASCTFGSETCPWQKTPAAGQTLYLYSINNNAYISELIIEFE